MHNKVDNKNLYIYTAISIILIYVAPIFILGENAYFRIGDNLDSNVVWYKLLIDNNMIFAPSSTIVPTIMGGLHRVSLPSEFDFLLWLNLWFGPVYGYAVNQLFMRIVAFFGMYFLLKKYVFTNEPEIEKNTIELISVGSSLCFSLLPFWPSGGLSVAGLPMVTFLLLEIKNNNDNWYKWAALLLTPFYSSFILVYFFYLLFAGIYWLSISIKERSFHSKLFLALFLLVVIHLFVNYRLLLELFNSTFISHRAEMSIAKAMGYNMISVSGLIKSTIDFLINGYHAHIASYQKFIILPSIFLAVVFSIFKHKFYKTKKIFYLILIVIIFSFIAKLWYFPPFDAFKETIPFFKKFNMSRVIWILPMIWYIIFALTLFVIAKHIKHKYRYIIILFLVAIQALYLFIKSDFVTAKKYNQPTFKQFFDTELFSKIKNDLLIDHNTTVAAIGLYPSILQYNGIKTVGGYSANYPLEYKKEFRKIISKVLEQDKYLQRNFDYWGSYCYIRVSGISNVFFGNKPKNITIDISKLNFEQMKKMGVKYIFSAYKIKKCKGLSLIKSYSSQNNFWKIYVYKLTDRR